MENIKTVLLKEVYIINTYKIYFDFIQNICKYKEYGFEENMTVDTCRHEENHPEGCSWGKCNEGICPLLR